MNRNLGRLSVLAIFACIAVYPIFAQLSKSGTRRSGKQQGMRQGMNQPFMQLLQAQQVKSDEFLRKEEEEGQEFMNSMAGKPKAELLPALKTYKTEQYERNCAFREEMFQERKTLLAGSSKSSGQIDEQRAKAMLSRMEQGYADMKKFFKTKHEENMAFIDAMALDTNMDGEALNKSLQDFMKSQKESARKYMEQRKSMMGGSMQGGGMMKRQ